MQAATRTSPHPALWLLLPVWIVVFAAIVPTVGVLIGEGSFHWAPLDTWDTLFTGFWNAIQPSSRGDHDMLQWTMTVLAWLFMVTVILVVPVLQWVMLMLPVTPPTAGSRGGTSLVASVLAVGLLATILTLMPVAASIDVLVQADIELSSRAQHSLAIGLLGVWILSWPLWTAILLRRAREQPDRFERFISSAIKGTAIGTGLSIPWYALIRSRESCYCGLCSYWSLVAGLWALLMLGGPLLLVLCRRRRTVRLSVCRACFHAKSPEGTRGDRCPECGRPYD
ncbi:MAG: hypothetical protein O2819_01920 [Planctomycetota bacterium]|nr:hypothetical protein [Planctomycetota bacterium]MDA1105507.1 hypothetical protein [Planctomycetota bacterium]